MCLYAHNLKPFKCDHDLVVYKGIFKECSKYVTAFRMEPVSLGKMLAAKGRVPKFSNNYCFNEINGGAIHAYIDKKIVDNFMANSSSLSRDTLFVKAIIKAGTPFFVSFDGREVAASSLHITDEFITKENYREAVNDNAESRAEVYKLMRNEKEVISNGGVKVGDAMLSDKTFVPAEEICKTKQKIIGIVGFIRPDGSPQVISLKHNIRKFSDKRRLDDSEVTHSFLFEDLDGYGYTMRAVEQAEDLSEYPAFEYCLKYRTEGTNEGDWYLPSNGEMFQTLKNVHLINETVEKIEVLDFTLTSTTALKIPINTLYWVSGDSDCTNSWGIYGSSFFWARLGYYNLNFVRPFLKMDA